LAGITITCENIDARKLHRMMIRPEFNHIEEAHDGGQLKGNGHTSNVPIIKFKDFDFPLPQQIYGLLPMHDSQRLIGGVE
jgi:hypothetical protein